MAPLQKKAAALAEDLKAVRSLHMHIDVYLTGARGGRRGLLHICRGLLHTCRGLLHMHIDVYLTGARGSRRSRMVCS